MNLSANHNIRQIVEICQDNEEPQLVVKLLNEILPNQNNATNNNNKIIIFIETYKSSKNVKSRKLTF